MAKKKQQQELVGYEAVAQHMGISRRTLNRYRDKEYRDTFPAPIRHDTKMRNNVPFPIAVYTVDQIDAFVKEHGIVPGGKRPGRKPSKA